MNWIDSYDATLARHDGKVPSETTAQGGDVPVAGASWQVADGTPLGRWRVNVTPAPRAACDTETGEWHLLPPTPEEAVMRTSWSAWDLRAYVDGSGPATRIIAGLPDAEMAMAFVDAFAGSRLLRMTHALAAGSARIAREMLREWRAR